jgi:RNA polymerase sigma-70 factor, ECF subfamily
VVIDRRALTAVGEHVSVLDVESFTALLRECYQRAWLVARAMTGDHAEADDVLQEASIIALRKRGDFTAGTNFAAWMSQIVRLTALNHVKKVSRGSIIVTDPATIDRTEATADRATNWPSSVDSDGRLSKHQMDFDDEVCSALREIGDVARACLLLRVVHQLSYEEIAETLEIPPGTAMSHVHRAKQSLRHQLGDRQAQSVRSARNQELR